MDPRPPSFSLPLVVASVLEVKTMPNGDESAYYADKDRERLNLATKLLCQLCGDLERDEPEIYHYHVELQEELMKWWKERRSEDSDEKLEEIRRCKERVQNALDKIDRSEDDLDSARRALGKARSRK